MCARWLVDGMNVIGSRPDGWWRDRPRAMRDLARRLDELAERTGDEVTVVFDGRPFDLEPGRARVLFATRRGPNAADDDIARIVGEDADPGSLKVVTSDSDLAARVRKHGAEVVGARGFRQDLPE
jgi:predicted RNA-binding protein with PIN domain